MTSRQVSDAGPRGQILAIAAVGMVVLMGMVGLVVDGGYAWGVQRDTQNAADASAGAGAAALAERLAGIDRSDGYIWSVVQITAAANGVPDAGAPAVNPAADCRDGASPVGDKEGICGYYTDADGELLIGASGRPMVVGTLGNAAPPALASGVRAVAGQGFRTFLAGAIGIPRLDSVEAATAVAGYVSEAAALPVTFPVVQFGCDSTGDLALGNEGFSANTSYAYVIPLCSNDPGNVGWLDYSPPEGGTSELVEQVNHPSFSIPVPSWQFVAQTGNPNAQAVQDAVWARDGQVVLIPQFDVTCNIQPIGAEDDPNHGCPAANIGGTGQNQWYHLPQFSAFQLCGANGPTPNWCSDPYVHGAYLTGNDAAICDPINRRATSCLVGRFVSWITDTTVTGNVGANAGTGLIGVQLIR